MAYFFMRPVGRSVGRSAGAYETDSISIHPGALAELGGDRSVQVGLNRSLSLALYGSRKIDRRTLRCTYNMTNSRMK